MTNEEAKIVLDKYNKGLASPAEVALLQYWFIHEASKEAAAMSDSELQQIVAGMRKEVLAQTKPNHTLWTRIARLGMAWKVAAAVAAITLGIWFYNNQLTSSIKTQGNNVAYQNDIAPGKNTATLTLPNGKTITLSDAKTGVIVNANEMKYNDGAVVDSALRGGTTTQSEKELLTAATPRGGTYQFTLPDGTKVWLNAASKISFPAQFSGATRKILLNGEAYFEVAKNKAKPFIVQSEGQRVEVLGTHFNINAYPDESNIRTTLLEGSVKIEGKLILKPGEQSNISSNGIVSVKQVDPTQAIAWKNGIFDFNNTPLQSIMRQVSRWYDVEVIYQDEAAKNVTLSGAVSRYDKVSRVLKALEFTGSVKFTIQGQRICVESTN